MTPRRVATAAVLLVAAAATPGAARAQNGSGERVRVVEAGPAGSGRLLDAVLAGPHVVRLVESGRADLPRDSAFATTVLVLGGTATVASRVAGDVVVVGGDLFLHPGAEIAGDAVAIGGCVYDSALATVRGARRCFREGTFVVGLAPDGARTLAYRSFDDAESGRWYYLPGFYGVRVPAYDRVNGLSLGWGPTLSAGGGRFELDPRATYRSDLGAVDPSAELRARVGRGLGVVLGAARGTYSNDAWIRSDVVNAIGAFGFGSDTRNYWRADRLEANLVRVLDAASGPVELTVGVRSEDARSVNPDSTSTSAPYSLFDRRDRREGMLRANPQGTDGRISAALLGATVEFGREDLASLAALAVELPFDAPADARFVQATLDATTSFLAFGSHTVQAGLHAVLTRGDPTPRQRYAYLGGSGTLPTELLLGAGGDELLFVDGLYMVPLTRVALPLVGAPSVGVRYAAGSVGVRSLPRVTQNVGLRIALSRARLDVLVNPATRESNVSLGVTAAR